MVYEQRWYEAQRKKAANVTAWLLSLDASVTLLKQH